jgi:hypothetical protein
MLTLKAREKLIGADHELFVLTLQHDRRLTGSERRAPLYGVRLAVKLDLQTWTILAQPLMVFLRIDFFHRLIS